MLEGGTFSLPAQDVFFAGLLFDMDGTIIDSTEAVVKHWHRYISISLPGSETSLTSSSIGKELGADPEVILQTSHGRRSIDTLKLVSPEKANWDCE